MEAKGIKNITEIVDAAIAVTQVVQQAKADGKIDLNDLGLVFQLVPKLGPAVEDMGEVIPEFKDLSAEEASSLVSYVMGKLSIADAHAQAVIVESLKLAAQAFALFKAITAPKEAPVA